MSKTNHRREFVAKRFTTPPGDWCKGKHGAAKNRRGMKKFFNSRNRFTAKMNIVTKDPEDSLLLSDRKERFVIGPNTKKVMSGEHNHEGNGPYSDASYIARGYVKIASNAWKLKSQCES